MTTKHLLEVEIQHYAMDKVSCGTQITNHIHSCEACRLKSETYRIILTEIKEQPKPVFDFNLADLVMKQLQQPQQKISFENIILYFTTFVSILIDGFAIYFFSPFLTDVITGITPIVAYLVITTLASLLIFLGIDMFVKYNRQMKILNFN